MRLLTITSIVILIAACKSKDPEPAFNENAISSIESKNGKVVFHLKDDRTKTVSIEELGTLVEQKKISEKMYLFCLQKLDEEQLKTQPFITANKFQKVQQGEINGRKVSTVDYKSGKFIFHLADNTTQSYPENEIGCLLEDNKLTEETYLLCLEQFERHQIMQQNGHSGIRVSLQKRKCQHLK